MYNHPMKKINFKDLKYKISEFKEFVVDDKDLMHYASSLSFHTILSILPILMISLSVFTKLPSFDQYYEKIKNFIFSNLLPSHQSTITQYLDQFLNNSTSLGMVGFVGVIFTSLMFFIDFERVISRITNSQTRGFFNSLSKYWTLLTLAPIGLGASFYMSGILQDIFDKTEFTNWINIIAILPYIIIWAMFAITYAAAINREIVTKNLIISSLISSLLWFASKTIFIQYAFYNKTYLSIYGSFSVALFFFLWIYISWIIFLYGVKIYAFLDEKNRRKSQNRHDNSKDFPSNS